MKHSFSKLKCFEQCPAKYNYRYNLNLADTPGPAAQRGTLMHKFFEDYLATPGVLVPPDLTMYTGFLNNLKTMGAKPEFKFNLNEEWIPVEKSSWLVGYIDALIVDPPDATVFDWKTGKEYDDHYEQKEIYALGTFYTFPELSNVRAVHVYTDLGRNTERIYHKDQMPAMRDRWTDRFKKLEAATDFFPKPQFLCRYCSYSTSNGGPCRF